MLDKKIELDNLDDFSKLGECLDNSLKWFREIAPTWIAMRVLFRKFVELSESDLNNPEIQKHLKKLFNLANTYRL